MKCASKGNVKVRETESVKRLGHLRSLGNKFPTISSNYSLGHQSYATMLY